MQGKGPKSISRWHRRCHQCKLLAICDAFKFSRKHVSLAFTGPRAVPYHFCQERSVTPPKFQVLLTGLKLQQQVIHTNHSA